MGTTQQAKTPRALLAVIEVLLLGEQAVGN